jgi:predicted phage-related endonuclease
MTLTDEQKLFRSKLLGGSDANTIMGGNEDYLIELWKVKTGQQPDPDLSDVLNVQMGVFTEPFNIQWFEKQTGRKVTDNGTQRTSPFHSFMGCTLDGLTDDGETVFEAKHVSAFSKEDEVLERYFPQLTHNMLVCGVKKAVLSVFFGNSKWEKFEVGLDELYADILIGAEAKFWECVTNNTPPVPIKVRSPIDAVRRVDMTGNNQWANFAAQLKLNSTQKKLYDEAVSGLKGMIEEDVAEASGYGITFKRDKRGALRMKGE